MVSCTVVCYIFMVHQVLIACVTVVGQYVILSPPVAQYLILCQGALFSKYSE